MIASVFKPSRRQNGKRVQSRIYWGQLRLSPDDPIERFSLKTTDRRVAEKKLQDIVTEREREAAGILAPKPLREAAQRPLGEHTADYLADLKKRQRSREHLKHVRIRLGVLVKACGWEYPKDVSSNSFIAWRSTKQLSPKTLNEYLSTAHAFMDWMLRCERVPLNPLAGVQRAETRGTETMRRRALSDEEVRSLLKAAGRRRIVYLTALHTGLRYGELKQLRWGDVKLEAETPHVRARASTTKNRRDSTIFLSDELATALLAHRPSKASDEALVFAGVMPVRRTWRADFDAAGIARVDGSGKRADFHALRYTLATNLAKAGVSPRVAMEFMRHSDMRLTAKTYTDVSGLPTAAAAARLPRYADSVPINDAQRDAQPNADSAQIHAQPADPDQHGVTPIDAAVDCVNESQILEESGVGAHDDASWHALSVLIESMEPGGIEPPCRNSPRGASTRVSDDRSRP